MEVNSYRDVSRAVFGYIKKNYPDMYLTLYSGESGKFTSKLAALKMSHGGYVTENNVVLFFDNSLFGGLKENYVITTDTICVRNPFEKQMYFSIKDVKQVTFDQKNIYINDWFRVDIGVCRLGNPELANMFVFCICSLLLLQEKAHYTYFSTQEMSKDELSADSNIRKCSCGNVISASDAFCSRCGKPNNGESQEWICGHCNEKNPKVARFCGSCGTPKE